MENRTYVIILFSGLLLAIGVLLVLNRNTGKSPEAFQKSQQQMSNNMILVEIKKGREKKIASKIKRIKGVLSVDIV